VRPERVDVDQEELPMRSWSKLRALILAAVAAAALSVPAAAGAATVANGDFETGSLSGWQVYNSSPAGNWFAYSGTSTPFQKAAEEEEEEAFPPFFAPPQGTFAAVSDEQNPDTAILYQDVALEPYYSHQLTMTFYYRSLAPITVPNPNTLSLNVPEPPNPEEGTNQQARVDVMSPAAPIESLNPSDILATLFANRTGDPTTVAPTILSADLTPFAGQTVRLRIANAVNDFIFNTGVDAVSIASTPPNNVFKKGKLKLNKSKGTGTLTLTVPGAGILQATDAAAAKKASASKAKKKKKLVKPATLKPTKAGQVKVPLKPTGAGKKILKEKGKLKIKVSLSFTPTGGFASKQTFKGTLKLNLK
jgi:hypothetical protein